MLLHHQAAPVVCLRQKIVRENKWGRGAFYFCVVCIFPSSHLYFGWSLSSNGKLEKFADTNVCGGAS